MVAARVSQLRGWDLGCQQTGSGERFLCHFPHKIARAPQSVAEQLAARQLQTGLRPATIASVQNLEQGAALASGRQDPFQAGAMVVVTLGNPREKFWGALLALTPEGLSLCGIELASFEDLVSMVKEGESFSPGVVFFPMHRIERMELDLPDGNIPSLSQRFTSKTGLDPATVLTRHTPARLHAPEEQR